MIKSKIIAIQKDTNLFKDFKYFIKSIFRRSRYNYKISTNLNLDIKRKKKFITKVPSTNIKEKVFLLSTSSGLFILDHGKLYRMFNNNGFYGIAKYKKKIFAACLGNHHSQGCIISFSYSLGEIKNINFEYKIRKQCFHDMKI